MDKIKEVFKKLVDIFKKPLWLLCLGLGIVLVFSIFANVANTSFWQVSVTEVSFETEHGKMTGLLYRPRSCTAEKPCATIVTTHGYLNTKEMQDAPAIELSKRGYVVLAMDMYEHGDSYWDASEHNGNFEFAGRSQWDAVQWVYDQDYVLKATDGTGMIAVSGHSMGGFSTRLATGLDSDSIAAGNPQKIVAALPVGADFSFAYPEFGLVEPEVAKYPFQLISGDTAAKRTMGTIAARYDEFFFCEGFGCGAGKVAEKDWTLTTEGAQFYYSDPTATKAADKDEIKSGVWNTESYGGAGSVIYVPNEIHPWNHFSAETTAYEIDFYTHAFKTQLELHGVTENEGVTSYKAGKAQSWWLKEGFECIALAGMFLAVVAAIATFAQLPFFNKVTTAEVNEVEKKTGARKWLALGFAAMTTFGLAYLYPTILGATTAGGVGQWYTDVALWIARAGAIVSALLLVVRVVLSATGKETEQSKARLTSAFVSLALIIGTALLSYWTLTYNFFGDTRFYGEETTNTIAKWAFACGAFTLLSVSLSHALLNKRDGYTLANYGLKANWKQILIGLLIAIITVTGVYLVTFAVEALLRVDFRIWTYAIKPFAWRHFVAALKYLPFFLLFYFANAVSVVATTGEDKTWKGTLKAILFNICGVVFILALQYGKDFVTGTAEYPGEGLSILLLFAIVPTLAVAAWIARKSYQKTGNIWTAVFINALLFTMMQVANTILHVYATIAL